MPICPIYGFGVLIITILLHPFMDIPILMFICSSLICTAFELFVGVTMKMIFHNVWWDYSDEHFNFKGYICLKTSILWGMGCLIVEYCAEPQIEWLVDSIPTTAGTVFIGVMGVLIVIDCSNSVAAVYKLNLRLKEISEISEKMYNSSQKLGKALADTALTAVDKGSEAAAAIYAKRMEGEEKAAELRNDIKENITDMKDETVEKLRARYDALVAFSDKNVERMIKAFPSMHSVKYRNEFENIRAKLRERASERKDRA